MSRLTGGWPPFFIRGPRRYAMGEGMYVLATDNTWDDSDKSMAIRPIPIIRPKPGNDWWQVWWLFNDGAVSWCSRTQDRHLYRRLYQYFTSSV